MRGGVEGASIVPDRERVIESGHVGKAESRAKKDRGMGEGEAEAEAEKMCYLPKPLDFFHPCRTWWSWFSTMSFKKFSSRAVLS